MTRSGQKHRKFNWSYNGFSQMPNLAYGVYAFWFRDNGRCVYVGQAKDQPIRKRLHDHWRGSHNEMLRCWIRSFGNKLEVCFLCAELKKIDRLERRLIKLWKPETNDLHNPNRRRKKKWR